MALKAPLIDARTPSDIADQTRKLLCHYLKDSPYEWPTEADGGEIGRALTGIFAHYCGLIVDRLNRAPEKNFLAFLDLLGNSLVSPTPAQAPVTFFLDARATEGINIEAGTRMQAEPGEGATDPIPFETSRDLWLTTLVLTGLRRGTADISRLINNSTPQAENVFAATDPYYFEFALTPATKLPVDRPVTLYFSIDSPFYDPAHTNTNKDPSQPLVWKYSADATSNDWKPLFVEDETQSLTQYSADATSNDWKPLFVEDETQSLTRTGTVEFLLPADFAISPQKLFRIRVGLPENDRPYNPSPVLRWVALNTVCAVQVIAVRDEVLGSCNGNPNQKFSTFRKPVLPGQQLQVMEQALIGNAQASAQRLQEGWIAWDEVTDWYGSTAQDRHYVLDRITGELRFGDGKNGMIPPLGSRNVRMHSYQSGGGVAGNVSVGAVKTLVAGAKRIEKIVNLSAAAGGADVETYESFQERAPKALRHRNRAVADADYEDLARLASTEVARVRCVPLLDLAEDPYGTVKTVNDEKHGAGKVSLIIVPRSDAPKPLPSQVLMRRVADSLRGDMIATASLSVVGPLYLRVDITTTVRLESLRLAARVERELHVSFAEFLHPLTGRYGNGWPFGRKPQNSDIYRLIKAVPGVEYVTALTIALFSDDHKKIVDDVEVTGRFLIYSGNHTVIPLEETV